MIPQMEPLYGAEEIKAVCKYLRSGGWLTEYKLTAELEQMLCEYLGVKHCVMMPNCTLALYAALTVLGVGLGDGVVVPGLTMIATANAAKMTGASLLFADIERETLCLNLERVEHYAKYTPNLKAIIYVSLNGRSGDMDALRALCARYNLWLIEDAAQSLGSQWNGRYLGTFGDVGCFSLSSQKVISTGNGGFCVTNDDGIARSLRLFKDFGRESGGNDDYTIFGINLKFTDLQAVIGIEQVKRLPERIERKKEAYSFYDALLWHISGVDLVPTRMNETTVWFNDALVQRRSELRAYLKEQGIGTRAFYPPLHKTPVYRGEWGHCPLPVCEEVSEKGLWLPSSPDLTEGEIHRICGEIERFYGG